MNCSCDKPMESRPAGEGNTLLYCHVCDETAMVCCKCGQYMKKDRIFTCSCGHKETFCKDPIFSFNGVYDSDCGKCPGDFKV